MRAITLSHTLILVQAAALSIALPLLLPADVFSSLATRGQVGDTDMSDAGIKAILTRPSPKPESALAPRRPPPTMTWYSPNSAVYVVITPITLITGDGVKELLENARDFVMDTIELAGDDLIPHGRFEFTGEDSLFLTVNNANNHQTTWVVLAGAVATVKDYMRVFSVWGSTTFFIYDGVNEVGVGKIG